ncbi:MAG TPA: ribonuclease P protein component [Bacteroidia bacterium]|nr:ribonuclease P protein component [Bacteroidia bacterium]
MLPATKVRLSFSKKHRLCSTKLIEQLYSKPSASSYLFPFKVSCLYTRLPEDVSLQTLISVSSRKFKHAHDRNRIKRQIREILRHQQPLIHQLLHKQNKQAALLITFVGKEHQPFAFMQERLNTTLQQLFDQHEVAAK